MVVTTIGTVLVRTASAGQTQALAEALAGLCRPGDVVVLAGEMGAGKTAFTQGFARGLGVTDPVTSPTFTIVREYPGERLNLHHLDVYRLEQIREVLELGVGEMLDEDAVMVVEWGDAVLPALGDSILEVRITFGEGDDDRGHFGLGHRIKNAGRWIDQHGLRHLRLQWAMAFICQPPALLLAHQH